MHLLLQIFLFNQKGYPLSTYAEFCEKLTKNVSFSENFAYVFNGWPHMQLQHELVIRLVDEDFYTNIPCFLEHTSFLRLEKCVACALYFIDFRSKHTYKPCASKKKKEKRLGYNF